MWHKREEEWAREADARDKLMAEVRRFYNASSLQALTLTTT